MLTRRLNYYQMPEAGPGNNGIAFLPGLVYSLIKEKGEEVWLKWELKY